MISGKTKHVRAANLPTVVVIMAAVVDACAPWAVLFCDDGDDLDAFTPQCRPLSTSNSCTSSSVRLSDTTVACTEEWNATSSSRSASVRTLSCATITFASPCPSLEMAHSPLKSFWPRYTYDPDCHARTSSTEAAPTEQTPGARQPADLLSSFVAQHSELELELELEEDLTCIISLCSALDINLEDSRFTCELEPPRAARGLQGEDADHVPAELLLSCSHADYLPWLDDACHASDPSPLYAPSLRRQSSGTGRPSVIAFLAASCGGSACSPEPARQDSVSGSRRCSVTQLVASRGTAMYGQ